MLYEQGADALVLGLIVDEYSELGGGVRQLLKAGHADDVTADQGDQRAVIGARRPQQPVDVRVGCMPADGEEPVVDGSIRCPVV